MGISHPRAIGLRDDPSQLPPFEAKDLTDAELAVIGEQLYNLLRRFRGYEAAVVGWDPESFVDVAVLDADYVPDGSISRIKGLVLSDALMERWHPNGFVPFAPGYSWVPREGSRNLLR